MSDAQRFRQGADHRAFTYDDLEVVYAYALGSGIYRAAPSHSIEGVPLDDLKASFPIGKMGSKGVLHAVKVWKAAGDGGARYACLPV